MKAYVSLWSSDLLEVGGDIDRVSSYADGFHIDITDGHLTPHLLFGPDFVTAVRQRTTRLIDVHLMVAEADAWIDPFIGAGADIVTVHRRSTPDLATTLRRIEASGASPSLAVEVDEPIPLPSATEWAAIDRLLLMGTAIGIKGVDIDPRVYSRVADSVTTRSSTSRRPDIFVDGGIRQHTVPKLATAGADGVIPGSLVYASQDPAAIFRWIHGLNRSSVIPVVGAS